MIPGTGLGPGLHGVVGSLDGGLAGPPKTTSAREDVLEGKMVTAGRRLNSGEGSADSVDGREGCNAFGKDVIPGTGLGPGLRKVVGSFEGGRAGPTELTSDREDVLAWATRT